MVNAQADATKRRQKSPTRETTGRETEGGAAKREAARSERQDAAERRDGERALRLGESECLLIAWLFIV